MSRALAAALLALAACSAVDTYMGRQPRPPPEQGAWATARDAQTRSGKLYDGLGANAFVSVVYLSPAVRDARAARLALWEAMTPPEREALLAKERAEGAKYDDFVVSLFTPDRADNDLDAKPSVWRLAVALEGQEALPVDVEMLRADARVRALFPNVGDFDVVYRVRFLRWDPPITGKPFVFRMAGARGRLDLDFGRAP